MRGFALTYLEVRQKNTSALPVVSFFFFGKRGGFRVKRGGVPPDFQQFWWTPSNPWYPPILRGRTRAKPFLKTSISTGC